MALKVNVQKKEENNFVVSLIGSLDTDTYVDCEEKLASTRELTYISSAGLSIVFRAKQTVEKNGGTIVIANLQPNVKRIFGAVRVISESLFATLDGSDESLDEYIKRVSAKNKNTEGEDKTTGAQGAF